MFKCIPKNTKDLFLGIFVHTDMYYNKEQDIIIIFVTCRLVSVLMFSLQDEVTVNVVELQGIRINAPLKRLQTGTQVNQKTI